jgi:hypothetical protein
MSPMVRIARHDRRLEHHRTGEPRVAIRERVTGPNDAIWSLVERNVTIGTVVPNNDREWRATVDEDGHYCFAMAL